MKNYAPSILCSLGCNRTDNRGGILPRMCNRAVITNYIYYLKSQKNPEMALTIRQLEIYLRTNRNI
jgi:hypothetical protein